MNKRATAAGYARAARVFRTGRGPKYDGSYALKIPCLFCGSLKTTTEVSVLQRGEKVAERASAIGPDGRRLYLGVNGCDSCGAC